MIEIIPKLFVGNGNDLLHVDDGDNGVKEGWFVVSAARDPWHREALGYTGRGAPKESAEYLWAHRQRRLLLNLVDVPDPKFFSPVIMSAAVDAIALLRKSTAGDDNEMTKVLIHCNEGRSRAPGIALWYLHQETSILPDEHDDAIEEFTKLYSDYAPSAGIAGFIKENW